MSMNLDKILAPKNLSTTQVTEEAYVNFLEETVGGREAISFMNKHVQNMIEHAFKSGFSNGVLWSKKQLRKYEEENK